MDGPPPGHALARRPRRQGTKGKRARDVPLAIVSWIENVYHRRRRQDTLDRLTPIEFETLHPAAQAA